MLGGVAVRDFQEIARGRDLRARIRTREGAPEMYFLIRDSDRVLPVYHAGALHVLRWGNQRSQSKILPNTAWAMQDGLETGRWASLKPEDAVVPASRALDNDVWYDVREGIRAIVVRDEQAALVVYPLVERSSHYYRIMTGSDWMPCLLRQRI
jgi:hypothetical protein